MPDLFEQPETGGNAHEFTVSEISGAVKKTIESTFGHVRVRGEVGRVLLARSGHLYFDLKDERAVISAVSWKGQVAQLAIMPEEGMEVIVTGRMTTFAGQSKYQLIAEAVEPAGAGALMAMLEKRKKALAAEGLFAPERKKKLPYLPEVIGVVTSPSGAVIRDILHRLRDRFPRKVLIWPVAVQGKTCAPEVARAIRGFNALTPGGALPRPDLLIVARGGGSVEDLWGFNEEEVARAAAASDIPLISAVGHETDTTLIDYVSDERAPTPTAAAELAVPVRMELLAWVGEQKARLSRALSQGIAHRRQRLDDLSRALPRPATLLENAAQQLDRAGERLPLALKAVVQHKRLDVAKVGATIRPDGAKRRLLDARRHLDERASRLRPEVLRGAIERAQEQLEQINARFARAARVRIEGDRKHLEALERMRQSLGYTETLRRGYAVVRADGAVAGTVARAKSAKMLEIEFADGRMKLAGPAAAGKASASKAGSGSGSGGGSGGESGSDGQGSLF